MVCSFVPFYYTREAAYTILAFLATSAPKKENLSLAHDFKHP